MTKFLKTEVTVLYRTSKAKQIFTLVSIYEVFQDSKGKKALSA